MTAALFFHPEGYSTKGPKLMGRHAAGESFLRGFLQHARQREWWAYVHETAHAQEFASAAKRWRGAESVKAIDRRSIPRLTEPGTLFVPGPGLDQVAFERSLFKPTGWSLCGITHTTSSAGAMDAITSWLTAPIEPWDAVICTSSAVKSHVTALLQAEADRLRQRLGITQLRLPQLPVIPLGIHTADFAPEPQHRQALRQTARQSWQVDADTLVVLYLGRLSFHAKAHPLAMYQALEQAAQATGHKVLLLEVGWHANSAVQQAYAEAARVACPSVRVQTLDGRDPSVREQAWAGADIFCSLSDNIQETFGITPLEAMAAGLPVVVTDWDGYRDTVRDGVDGFCIPTWMPHDGLGGDLATRHALGIDNYDYYCGHTCSFVGVDVHAAAQAFVRLMGSSDLRRQMGSAGQARARSEFDWRHIIPRYEALWAELADRRRAAASPPSTVTAPWPARADPFTTFKAYPTHQLQPGTWLKLVDASAQEAIERFNRLRSLKMVEFAQKILPPEDAFEVTLRRLADGPVQASALFPMWPQDQRAERFRALVFLIKLNLIVAQADRPIP